jgi:formylglycine-generating enzyme required for sulfatase activity
MIEYGRGIFCGIATLILTGGFLASAQEVSIPDPGLNAAIREALQKPSGPLTQQDMLSLTFLSACCRDVRSVEGLEAARNLRILDLHSNSLTNFGIASALTNLTILDLFDNEIARFVLSNALPGLTIINVGFNSLTQCSLPPGLTNLDTLFLEGNLLTNFNLPAGLTALTQLDLSANQLTRFTAPADMTNLVTLLIFANQLTNLTMPPNLHRLGNLDVDFNELRALDLPAGLTNLVSFVARDNQLTNLSFPADMTSLGFIDVGGNQLLNLTLPAGLTRLNFLRLTENKLTRLTLPPGLTNLTGLFAAGNQLTNLTLPSDLIRLVQIDLGGNKLTGLTLPPGLTNLSVLILDGNQLTHVTLPPDMAKLGTLNLSGNPLTTLVLSEPLAATRLAPLVASLTNQGVSVFTYPLVARLVRPRMFIGAFHFGITGPPGVYAVMGSTNLAVWEVVGTASNALGSINFNDVTANLSSRKFYRVLLQGPPTNMVFIPPNTFTMGSPPTELHRDVNEGPQTVVTLSRGFWIGKYEVTQGEYLSVTGTNPSQFPGDLNRPVSSVSWPDATNYCAKLTQRELAAGRIPAGSQYRLPTEAEWECAARAGTTTRFSHGDDPEYSNLPSHAWQSLDDGLTVHPVGQKLPNPWGLYDMAGNVFEWCQDWLGPLPGGSVTDPQGPPSNPIGWKIMRGGAFDVGGSACRSASRMFFGNHPALTDWNLGFRVVLVTGP